MIDREERITESIRWTNRVKLNLPTSVSLPELKNLPEEEHIQKEEMTLQDDKDKDSKKGVFNKLIILHRIFFKNHRNATYKVVTDKK